MQIEPSCNEERQLLGHRYIESMSSQYHTQTKDVTEMKVEMALVLTKN